MATRMKDTSVRKQQIIEKQQRAWKWKSYKKNAEIGEATNERIIQHTKTDY